ncbi:oxidoreductase [Malaciobacter molluscorum LMG 25693]|uniref:Oxidoreductase n=1 Tax=Malaciobacter molluscorum LMG 25693 TaxID=870501 RepID=A0A2G1DG35_9BACT|nr:YhdH/YhfP family quinone oxidoreductase [Malaciobacter molluscorum]AXX91081.1 quinone oxidoreductase, YhdH/YhfP family [Malaciobacter molluscorum LMG 25693]PHO17472.1 oxidoreductase [Malaciobacter molluscorum LMG 25693]
MKAFVVEKLEDKKFTSSIKEIDIPEIGEDEVLIKASYSSLNYKDALSSVGNPGVTKVFPHVTGIDVSGIIEKSNSKDFIRGNKVLVTGYDLGMNTNGGHQEYVKVPAKWVIKIPDNLTEEEIMTYGTAGLTAALSINELEENGIKSGKILVTGATGGVGSIAVSILSKLNYEVVAITGKKDKEEFLKTLGANKVILRDEFDIKNRKPLLSEEFDGVIDTVGGDFLAHSLKLIKHSGVATCCGLTSSFELNTNVFPFILRGIRLIGIDSVEIALEKKEKIWNKIANEYKITNIDKLVTKIDLSDIKQAYENILSSKSIGRYLVKI